MNVGAPLLDVVTDARGRLLTELVRLERPASILELATVAGVDNRHAGRTVDELLVAGLVTETRAGRSRMVAMNREHLAFDPVSALVAGRHRFVEQLRAEMEPLDKVAGAWLFGSAARGDGDVHSDVDILLVSSWISTTSRGTSSSADCERGCGAGQGTTCKSSNTPGRRSPDWPKLGTR